MAYIPVGAESALFNRVPARPFPASYPVGLLSDDPRQLIANEIERLIALLDSLDGDPDLEANGDELDGTAGEDDFCDHSNWLGEPGCPVSDPGGGNVEDEGQMGAGQDYYRTLPVYGVDQTQGPINHEQIVRVEKLIEMERDYQLSGQFEQAKKIVARLKTLGHPAMSH